MLAIAVAASGCAARHPVPVEARLDPAFAPAGDDYRAAGPGRVGLEQGATASPYGCELAWTRYRPDPAATATTVVLAHGFLRDRQAMDGLARHLAGWGVPVVSVDLCNAGLLRGAHTESADDLRAGAGCWMRVGSGSRERVGPAPARTCSHDSRFTTP